MFCIFSAFDWIRSRLSDHMGGDSMTEKTFSEEPPNLRQVEKCCGTCKHGGHGYDGETCCDLYLAGIQKWDEVCDDWTNKESI